MEPIYFSKIQFAEYVGHGIHGKSIILLDLDNRELYYQVLGAEKRLCLQLREQKQLVYESIPIHLRQIIQRKSFEQGKQI